MRFNPLGAVAGVCVVAFLVGPAGPTGDGAPAAIVSPHNSSTGSGAPSATARPLRVVALGDSVTAGYGCGCDAFPAVYGRRLADQRGAPGVSVANEGVNGLDSAGLLAQLAHDTSPVAREVAAADVVVVTIGANDFGDHHSEVTEGGCSQGDCVDDELDQMRSNVESVLARVRALRAGRPTTVLLTGYWNVFEDGDVARESFPDAGVAASISLTRRTNTALRSAAAADGATYVDLFTPFQRSGTDITRLLVSDGDHPNGQGHDLIAGALMAAGLPGLSSRWPRGHTPANPPPVGATR